MGILTIKFIVGWSAGAVFFGLLIGAIIRRSEKVLHRAPTSFDHK